MKHKYILEDTECGMNFGIYILLAFINCIFILLIFYF